MMRILLIIAFIVGAVAARTIHDTGLPYIVINTDGGVPVASKTEYVGMTFALVDPSDPRNNVLGEVASVDVGDTSGAMGGIYGRIRGRGNDSWNSRWARKKSYRVRLADKVSLFGLEPSRSFTLLAQHRDETLLYNAIPFELGRRFGMRFNHSVNFVDLYMNGEYMGNYLLTEHRHVAAGRVDIDRDAGWLVELDEYYDSEPKFRTASYNLPVMIKFPGRRAGVPAGAAHERVINDMNALADALATSRFPESGYRDLIDMESFIAYLMINEIAANTDLSHPRSSYMYRDKDAPISMGPLWDFDSGYGWNYRNWLESGFNDHFNYPERRPPKHEFFRRFYDDPVFLARFKETWNARYDDIASMTSYIDVTARRLERSAAVNFQNWWYKTLPPFIDARPPMPVDYSESIARLKAWYSARVYYLDKEFNGVDAVPRHRNFGVDTACAIPSDGQRFTLVSIGEITEPRAVLQMGEASGFEIIDVAEFEQKPTGGGAYIAPFVTIRPKAALPPAYYHDTLVITVRNKGCVTTTTVPLDYTVVERPPPPPPSPERRRWRRWSLKH